MAPQTRANLSGPEVDMVVGSFRLSKLVWTLNCMKAFSLQNTKNAKNVFSVIEFVLFFLFSLYQQNLPFLYFFSNEHKNLSTCTQVRQTKSFI